MIRARVDYEITKPVITTPDASYMTNEEAVTIEGEASPTTTIQLNNNGEEVATAEIGDDGAFSFDTTLTEGANEFVATTRVGGDSAGSSEPVTITLDTVKPTLSISSPSDGDVTNRETVTVQGTASDENLNYVEVNGARVDVNEGHYSKRILLDEGVNEITVVAHDLAGNTETKTVTVTANWNAPTIENLLPSTDQTVNPGDEIEISFTSDVEGGTASFSVEMPLLSSLQSATSLPIEEVSPGVYSTTWVVPNVTVEGAVIVVSLTDASGNTTRQEAAGKITVEAINDANEGDVGWFYKDGKTYYLDSDGKKVKGWYEIRSKWYYFNNQGEMQTGMVTLRGDTYYLGDNGVRQVGWVDYESNRYYFNIHNGVMETGWIFDDGNAYYADNKGVIQTGMLVIKGDTYYFADDGVRQTGWVDHESKRYFFNPHNGVMQTGWIFDSGNTYYADNKGVMQTGWVKIKGTMYHFDENGVLIGTA